MVYSGPNSQGITFGASKFFVVSFLCVFQRNSSEFRGENNPLSFYPYPLRAHSLCMAQ